MLMNKAQGAMVEALLKNSPLAIVGLDERNRILLWSAAAERLLGWTAKGDEWPSSGRTGRQRRPGR